MAAPIGPRQMTAAEFIAWEERVEDRYEWVAGEVRAMSGGSPRHDRVITNLIVQVGGQLPGGCQVFGANIDLDTGRSYRHPDLTVVCGPVAINDDKRITNPTHLVEVLSPTTEAADRNEKWAEYRQLQSLETYTLVTITDEVLAAGGLVEQYTRSGHLWSVTTWGGTHAAAFVAGVEVPFEAIYFGAAELPA